ncbi:hypothetical protein M011DRAFT_476285 [Sporormia fimetaria CBS 119925]|uniref:FHA domain-containing protein n=1 Tax=Sporormia fimetaria CBS 119925 TaxID=1340428 RepID=A0A6A6VEM1_9PLEO|nr:hypothetical protein M011DRAFT_476285 [Sporormia fimetaria CBS 119925]
MTGQATFRVTLTSKDKLDSITQRRLLVRSGHPISIGRSSSNPVKKDMAPAADNAFMDNPVVSRRHAEFSADVSGDVARLLLTDQDSMHGTRVNGELLEAHIPYTLNPGDKLQFGADVIRADDTFIAPEWDLDYCPSPPTDPVKVERLPHIDEGFGFDKKFPYEADRMRPLHPMRRPEYSSNLQPYDSPSPLPPSPVLRPEPTSTGSTSKASLSNDSRSSPVAETHPSPSVDHESRSEAIEPPPRSAYDSNYGERHASSWTPLQPVACYQPSFFAMKPIYPEWTYPPSLEADYSRMMSDEEVSVSDYDSDEFPSDSEEPSESEEDDGDDEPVEELETPAGLPTFNDSTIVRDAIICPDKAKARTTPERPHTVVLDNAAAGPDIEQPSDNLPKLSTVVRSHLDHLPNAEIRRTQLSIPDIVGDNAVESLYPASQTLKRKAETMGDEEEKPSIVTSAPIAAPVRTPAMAVAPTEARPNKRVRRALTVAGNVAVGVAIGAIAAVGGLTALPESFFE